MKKIFLFFVFIIMLTGLFAYPWGHRYTTVQSWQDTTINKGSSLTFSVEWGEGDWTHSDLGYGLTTDGTDWTWVDIPWFENGEGNNKRCKTTVTFNTAGKYYYAYRMEKPENTYSYQHGSADWSENSATLSAVSYVEVNEPLPVILNSFTAFMVNNISTLNWITSSEENNMGWNIYRAFSENFGQAEKINTEFIPGAGTTTQETRYVYKDVFEPESQVYYYWLENVSFSGETHLSDPILLNIEDNDEPQNVPIQLLKYGLHQNYPNPFNPSTQISFILKNDAKVTLEIYNVKGQKVKTLFDNKPLEKDVLHTVTWNGRNDQGKVVSSGIYFYKLKFGKDVYMKKMLLTK